jgi:cupin fold WbuC family metalloprotein
MIGTRAQSAEVLVATGGVVKATIADLAVVCDRGIRSARKRARLCAHEDASDPLHEMLICLVRETYVRPHRHPGKTESFHVIDGELDVVLFEPDGAIRDVVRMGPYPAGNVFFYRLNEPCFHSVIVNTPHALIHETTNGPFDPDATEFAPWAPAEDHRDVGQFMNHLRTRTRA